MISSHRAHAWVAMLLAWQATAQAQSPATPPACPTPHEMRALHLYGAWRASWAQDATPATTLRLERHPELTDSVRGRVERDGQSIALAGDIDDGDLTLEESRDGRRISANWIGQVVPDSCGKEIRGTWTDADSGTQRAFILRRQGGWQ